MSELSKQARSLIETMENCDGPGRARRERVRRSLAVSLATMAKGGPAIAAVASQGAATVATGKALSTLAFGWCVLAGAATGTLIVVPATVLRAPATAVAPRAPPRVMPARPAVLLPPPAAIPPSEAAHGDVETAAPSKPASTPAARSARRAALAVAILPAPSLSEEMQMILNAQIALREHDPAGALAWLDRYDRRFGRALLAEEGGAIRVLSLCELGRQAEARRSAEAFMSERPSSPLVPRLRASCAFAGGDRGGDR